MMVDTCHQHQKMEKNNTKVLYVTDLDGTLLRSDEKTSEFTNETINTLINKGVFFSFATARSSVTAKKVTHGLNARFPMICYNGAFIIDYVTGEILGGNYFGEDILELASDLFSAGVYPIMYAYIDGKERFSFIGDRISKQEESFIAKRNDSRKREVQTIEELMEGNLYYIACIDTPEKLEPLYEKYKNQFHCVYQQDIYSHDQWLEIMPLNVSKANAIGQLKVLLGCEKVIAFGDGVNDIEMFQMADECYAVSNAAPELKAIATEVIGSNDEDSVAKWMINSVV